MKVTVNIDCTPQEARSFLGLPDVEPMQELIMAEMTKRAKENMDSLADPERLVENWMTMGGKSMEGLQAMMAAAMGSTTMGTGTTGSKGPKPGTKK